MPEQAPLIPKHGGYRKLKSFQVAQLVYDVTVRFCGDYVDRRSRTRDQMEQAARSGVQNIAEGSQVSATSKKMEMKLTGVARGSLEELRLDYEDFLRHRRLRQWDAKDPRRAELIARRPRSVEDVAEWVRAVHEQEGPGAHSGLNGLNGQNGQSTKSMPSAPSMYAEIAANAALALIAVAHSLLGRQLAAQAAAFERDGGFTKRLYRNRRAAREKPPQAQPRPDKMGKMDAMDPKTNSPRGAVHSVHVVHNVHTSSKGAPHEPF